MNLMEFLANTQSQAEVFPRLANHVQVALTSYLQSGNKNRKYPFAELLKG